MKKKLAIVTTHPIQYYAPIFQLLAERNKISVKVFYTWSQAKAKVYDPGFGRLREWDIPLLEGYEYEFVENVSRNPGSHHFFGIQNPSLIQKIDNWNADALLVIGWSFKSHLQCMRYFKGKITVLFRGDSTLLDEKRSMRKIFRRAFLKYVYSKVDYALYVGENNRRYYLKHGLKQKQLFFAPHAIDNSRFASCPEIEQKAMEWRRALGICEDDFAILYVGKLEMVKNPFYILELTKQVKVQNVKFLFVGNGPLEIDLKRQSEGDPRVNFINFQNQQKMPVVYRLSDIVILPSKSETWGLVINEAMACEKPIIVSEKVGCAVDLLKENENGYTINPNNPIDAVNKISTLINNKELVRKMGKRSKELIDYYSFENISNCIEKVLEQV